MPKNKKKIWIKAECWVTEAVLAVTQSAFLEASAIGIEIDDGVLPEGKRTYHEDQILVKAYFEADGIYASDIELMVSRFFMACGLIMPNMTFTDFVEEDWQGNFVKTCTTFKVEPDIFIVPSFEIDAFRQNPRGQLFIEMDPENAFGTGQHQTTKLCLTALRKILERHEHARNYDCLDVGTGSGILAILMKKLGAKSVLASETDEDALATAARNAVKNDVVIELIVVKENHIYQKDTFDVVVANILAPVLISMAPHLSSCVRLGGQLILSGILLQQAPDVVDAYRAHNLCLVQQNHMDDWCSLILQKDHSTGKTKDEVL